MKGKLVYRNRKKFCLKECKQMNAIVVAVDILSAGKKSRFDS